MVGIRSVFRLLTRCRTAAAAAPVAELSVSSPAKRKYNKKIIIYSLDTQALAFLGILYGSRHAVSATELEKNSPKYYTNTSLPDSFVKWPPDDLFLPPISGASSLPPGVACHCLFGGVLLCVFFVPLLSVHGTSGQQVLVASVPPTSSVSPHFDDHGVLGFSPRAPSVTGLKAPFLKTKLEAFHISEYQNIKNCELYSTQCSTLFSRNEIIHYYIQNKRKAKSTVY
ncbi:hypothetical protein C0J52_10155 [Blattella germanica]|nr:hypothetical protein C0J52_10155 [Blattella germanica]